MTRGAVLEARFNSTAERAQIAPARLSQRSPAPGQTGMEQNFPSEDMRWSQMKDSRS